MTAVFGTPALKPVSWWSRERVRNGLRRLARDYFGDEAGRLPQSSYGYRNAVPETQRRAAHRLRLYPPYTVVLRQYASLLEAWVDLGFEVIRQSSKTAPAEIAGWRFYRLTVIAYSHSAPGSGRIWQCRCVCGKEVFAAVKNLFRGRVRSCGCYRRTVLAKIVGLKNTKRLAGQKFGRLTAQRIVGKYQKQSLWECECECGSTVRVPTSSLTTGATRSCGCLRSETTRKRITEFWKRKNINMGYIATNLSAAQLPFEQWRIEIRAAVIRLNAEIGRFPLSLIDKYLADETSWRQHYESDKAESRTVESSASDLLFVISEVEKEELPKPLPKRSGASFSLAKIAENYGFSQVHLERLDARSEIVWEHAGFPGKFGEMHAAICREDGHFYFKAVDTLSEDCHVMTEGQFVVENGDLILLKGQSIGAESKAVGSWINFTRIVLAIARHPDVEAGCRRYGLLVRYGSEANSTENTEERGA